MGIERRRIKQGRMQENKNCTGKQVKDMEKKKGMRTEQGRRKEGNKRGRGRQVNYQVSTVPHQVL